MTDQTSSEVDIAAQAKAIEDQLDALESKLAIFLEAYGDDEEPAAAGNGGGSKGEEVRNGETDIKAEKGGK
ncbi:Protein of unknown function [Pyronema omphalodes CBS 100304]|uniref:Uncharacterized protein n=1 Tax=Pyronema omphalodes (strain CBS 100304) TaxID=1076935 RepID=U4LRA0_PYROM|nr:Protein of unknown function [Pyronema omphalodes CBS 100304]